MRGLDATSSWTHLIPGMIVSGLAVGLVNPPLASTAVGVVAPQRAGMASGINSTFRQVGIATGIALLGSLFSNKVRDEVIAMVGAAAGPVAAEARRSRPRCSRGRSAACSAACPSRARHRSAGSPGPPSLPA